jgi:hypothetical protein
MPPIVTSRRPIIIAVAAFALVALIGSVGTAESRARRDSPFVQLRSSLDELFAPPRRARRAKARPARATDSARRAPTGPAVQKQAERPPSPAILIPPPRPRPAEAPTRVDKTARLPAVLATPPKKEEPNSLPAPAPQAPAAQAPTEPSACQRRLGAEFAAFRALPPITGPGECVVEDVVLLEKVVEKDGRAIAITPPATLRCPMAEAVVHWIRDDVAAVARDLGTQLKSVVVDTSFECRSRNRIAGAKLSEHGRANAIDLRGFALANGKSFTLTDAAADKGARERLRQSACARFTTVLGPGSDGYHESHVHLDAIERRGGYRMCQWDVRDATVIAAMPLPPERPTSAPRRSAKAAKSGRRE